MASARATSIAPVVILLALAGGGLVYCSGPKTIQAHPNEFVGIGVQLKFVNETHVIERVFGGGPADAAGLHEGDRIVAIDGNPVQGRTLADVVDALRGKDGTEVVVRVASTDGEQTVAITRRGMKKSGTDYKATNGRPN